MSRVGLLGGTFDPPHRGHVSIATQVADALDLDRVEGFLRERGGPCRVDACPGADASLLALLRERAYALSEMKTTLELAVPRAASPDPSPPCRDGPK